MRLAFIGRFQPFHRGHMAAIDQFRDEHDVVAVIANAESRTGENPLNFEERKAVLEDCLELEIFTQENHPDDDEQWCREVVEKTGAEGVITRNGRTRDAVVENSDMEVLEQDYVQHDLYSGTEIRRRIRAGEEWRYLVPDCAEEKLELLEEVIKKSGIQYEFEPGWKKENAFHGTEED